MLILFLVLVTVGVMNSNCYDTRRQAANDAFRNIDASGQQGPYREDKEVAQEQALAAEYARRQNNQHQLGTQNQGYPVLPQNPNPNDENGETFAFIDPNGYKTINVGNGSGKKNTVILQTATDDRDVDELLVGVNRQNQYNPDVHGIPYNNKAGTSPCYHNGVLVEEYLCTQTPQKHNRPKTYNIGNGYNNENIVTIGGRGSSGSRGTPGGSKQHTQAYDISLQHQRSQGNGIKAVYAYMMALMCTHMMIRP